MLRFGSLFAGIGGFDLGLERAGMRVVWQCEQNEFCRRVLAHHWPGVPCYEDVRELRAVDVEPVDVLCGGFPCQDLSFAGLGAGIDGPRSGLWAEYARLVGELRPRYVVVENVSALLGRGLGRVLGDLSALGYDAEWDCIPASAVGAPHRRDRLWLVAYPQREGQPQQSRSVREERRRPLDSCQSRDVVDANASPWGWPRPTGEASHARVDAVESGRHGGVPRDVGDAEGDRRGPRRPGRSAPAGAREHEPVGPLQDPDGSALQPWRVGGRVAQAGGPEWWAVEPPMGRVAHGVPDRLDQLAALGNALVPQIAEWIGRRIVSYETTDVQAERAA